MSSNLTSSLFYLERSLPYKSYGWNMVGGYGWKFHYKLSNLNELTNHGITFSGTKYMESSSHITFIRK